MASKPPNINSVPNRDIMQRMNYLWQASVYLQSLNTSGVPNPAEDTTDQKNELKDNDAQAASAASASSEANPTTTTTTTRKRSKTKKTKRKVVVNGNDLARIYVKTMKTVGQKTTTKMDPGVKRTLCQGCSIVLIPGVSVRVRIRPSSQHHHWMVYKCLECGTTKSIPAPRSSEASLDDSTTSTTTGAEAPSSGVELSMTTDVDPAALGGDDGESNDRRLREDDDNPTDGASKEDATQQKPDVPRRARKKKKVIARVPLLFARRDAGHVVYRGGEVVDMEGVYCV